MSGSVVLSVIRHPLCVASVVLALALSPAAAGEPDVVDWNTLIDAEAQDYEDPFREVSLDHLETLASMVRLEEELASGTMEEELRPRMEARAAQRRAELEEAGIDIEWLLEQRWVVADRRRQAAVAVNRALDGQTVEVGGFLIPAPPTEDGLPTAYLVPERGMCSHMPPPPPNQLLQLVLDDLPETTMLYEPVIVAGTLTAEETTREVYVVDGPVPMWSAWTMKADSVSSLLKQQDP